MYKVTIGLEIHCELTTNSKVFSTSKNEYNEMPNSNLSTIDLGFPGILPAVNKEAVNKSVKLALALNCKVPNKLIFDRKNYYYPDLPKGYQITQASNPIGTNGYLDIDVNNNIKKILIHDIHLEEDTASLDHYNDYSLIDYNRAGVPLIEIVTEPCINSTTEALAFLESLRSLIVYCNASEARSDRGQIRCDVNISLSNTDKLGNKVEMKNINSFNGVKLAIEYEIRRQTELLNNNEEVIQETRRFDDKTSSTIRMRTKVDAIDYKYFTEPNIPIINLTNDYIENIKKEVPILQFERITKYVNEYNISKKDAETLTKSKEVSDFFDECINLNINPQKAANWINSMLLGYLNTNSTSIKDINPSLIGNLIDLTDTNAISSKQAKEVFLKALELNKNPKDIVIEENISQLDNDDELIKIIDEVLEENIEQVKDYTEEKYRMIDFFVGQVMKKTKGQANPSKTMDMIKNKIKQINNN
ncbi:MAG TPA: Asp-tRNA(Asn)/Glu-tRNA(Gln) amidotransferase subunit GatB [Bacilli bacterium]|nr:Asp-tRNA(Asn)/Glu-tRNA(Gln) amidotransferase subunit GatB [Bacilli bacterium]